MMTQRDKGIVRELAKKYMEMASSEKQQKMNKRMLDTNDLKIVRPPVILEEIPWYQMNIGDELTCRCEDEGARQVEYTFLKALFRWKHFKADTYFEPFFRVTMAYDSSGIGLRVQENTLQTDDFNNIISHNYEDLLESEDSVELLSVPTFTRRKDRDEEAMNFYTDLLGDAMPVKLCGRGYFHSAPWDEIATLRGLENILFDLYDRPEHLHAIRKKFMEIALSEMDFIEKEMQVDPHSPDLHCTPAYVSGLAEDGLKATWYRTTAQGFSDVSPEMHDEFDIQYSLDLAKRFAYTYYGCCEPLDRKLDQISKIENLRKIGVSPWAKEEVMAEWIGNRYVYARKSNPANVSAVTDPEIVRRETEKSVKLAIKYGCPLELVLKDISTVSHRPENLIVWSEVVSGVLDEFYGE
ncbi:MAG: hypothetical protein IJN07_07260 [Clostridia bacterium]|nr:hypothetical protein [Clostridia bacterium]